MIIEHIPEYFITDLSTNVHFYKIITNNTTIKIDMRFISIFSKHSICNNLKYWPTLCHKFISNIPPETKLEIIADNKILDVLFLENDNQSKITKLQWEHTDFFSNDSNIPSSIITPISTNEPNEIMPNVILCPFSSLSNGFFITSPNNNLITYFKLTLNNQTFEWNNDNFWIKFNDNVWYLPFNNEDMWSKNTNNAINLDKCFQIKINYKSFMPIYNSVKIFSLELQS